MHEGARRLGHEAAYIVLPESAQSITKTRTVRAQIVIRIQELVKDRPLQGSQSTMPRIGIRTQARILTLVCGPVLATAGHPAVYDS